MVNEKDLIQLERAYDIAHVHFKLTCRQHLKYNLNSEELETAYTNLVEAGFEFSSQVIKYKKQQAKIMQGQLDKEEKQNKLRKARQDRTPILYPHPKSMA